MTGWKLRLVLAVMIMLVVAALATHKAIQHTLDLKAPWQENYSKAKGELMSAYGFPYVFNYFLLHSWGESGAASTDKRVHSTINRFHHIRSLTKADYRDGGSPNNDTLYSVSWAYVDQEPVIISVPAMDAADRYWAIEIAAWNSDNYAYLGARTTGMDGGDYALVPPGWDGVLPEGVTRLSEAPTKWSFLLGRTLVNSESDLANVHEIQNGYEITALSEWGKSNPTPPYAPPLNETFKPILDKFEDKSIGFRGVIEGWVKQHPDEYLRILNQSISMGGIPESEKNIFRQFEEVGLVIDDPVNVREDFLSGRDKGISLGILDVVRSLDSNYYSKMVNGWRVLDSSLGRAGVHQKFLFRSSAQSLGGIVANDPEEAVYFVLQDDPSKEGIQSPDGESQYTLHFEAGMLPEVDAFWSLSAYDKSNNLIDNQYDRYSRGDRDELVYNDDGSLTIYIGKKRPPHAVQNNWLPVDDEEFYLIFRTYLPGESIISQEWSPPALVTGW